MAMEAGGRVTDFEGRPFAPEAPGIVATNGLVHQAILDVLNAAGPEGGRHHA
jgi:myo-inositol-1(or 4)-monophosphatase